MCLDAGNLSLAGNACWVDLVRIRLTVLFLRGSLFCESSSIEPKSRSDSGRRAFAQTTERNPIHCRIVTCERRHAVLLSGSDSLTAWLASKERRKKAGEQQSEKTCFTLLPYGAGLDEAGVKGARGAPPSSSAVVSLSLEGRLVAQLREIRHLPARRVSPAEPLVLVRLSTRYRGDFGM
ncbi:hypothetical protein MTO96_021661 [Rhipicephalus appendiculatus]